MDDTDNARHARTFRSSSFSLQPTLSYARVHVNSIQTIRHLILHKAIIFDNTSLCGLYSATPQMLRRAPVPYGPCTSRCLRGFPQRTMTACAYGMGLWESLSVPMC